MSAPDTAMAEAMAKALRAKAAATPKVVSRQPKKVQYEEGVVPEKDDIRSLIERNMK